MKCPICDREIDRVCEGHEWKEWHYYEAYTGGGAYYRYHTNHTWYRIATNNGRYSVMEKGWGAPIIIPFTDFNFDPKKPQALIEMINRLTVFR